MPRYEVTLHETLEYEVIVDALDREEAEDLAGQVWAASSQPMVDFPWRALGVEAVEAEEVPSD